MLWMQIRILLAQGRESLKGRNFSLIYFTRTYLNGGDREKPFGGSVKLTNLARSKPGMLDYRDDNLTPRVHS